MGPQRRRLVHLHTAPNYAGTDTFTYRASDGTTTGNIATVTITVTGVNDAPAAVNNSYTTDDDVALQGNVLTNDTDVDGNPLTAHLVSGPTHGALTLNADGTFTYTPAINYHGTDTFTYRPEDGSTTSDIATVTITINDTTTPTAVGVHTTNGGGTNGLIQQGDTIVYTFSEPIDPDSILDGWDGSTTSVYVRVYDGDILLGLLGGNDTLQVFNPANNQVLPLGSVNLDRGDYVTGLLGGDIRFGLSGTPSTMTMSGNTVTIVLGNYTFTPLLGAVRSIAGTSGTHTMVWTPSTTPEDLAGNSLSSVTAT